MASNILGIINRAHFVSRINHFPEYPGRPKRNSYRIAKGNLAFSKSHYGPSVSIIAGVFVESAMKLSIIPINGHFSTSVAIIGFYEYK